MSTDLLKQEDICLLLKVVSYAREGVWCIQPMTLMDVQLSKKEREGKVYRPCATTIFSKKHTLQTKKKHKTPKTKPRTGMATVPYMQTISGKISRLLANYYIKTIH
jgi:hypothetical protein